MTASRARLAGSATLPTYHSRTAATSPSAHAVGVRAASLATRSATETSPVWPIPVRTGTGQPAIARATASWSNAARSAWDPPPRTTQTTSQADRPSDAMAVATS